jgi:adenylate cyclase class IV
MRIEVEYRAFIDDKTYHSLEKIFKTKYKYLGEEKQITYYLNTETDTRIQLSNEKSKLWQKSGQIHDISREEINIYLDKDEGIKMIKIFENLGYNIEVTWYRLRKSFHVSDNFRIELDKTIGYGKIIEVEILCNESEVEASKKKIVDFFKKLGVHNQNKDVFNEAYKLYLQKWKSLTKELSSDWLET